MKDLVDPRQREAAALLLSAIDLPAEASAWARQLQQAANICPGIKAEATLLNSRRAGLERAAQLIATVLQELSE